MPRPIATWALLTSLWPCAAAADQALVPVQADLSVVGHFDAEPTSAVALFVGYARGRANPPFWTPFGTVGFELTYSGRPEPYRMSMGAQLRGGLAWGEDRGQAEVLPDLLLFTRLTPFVASTGGYGKLEDKEVPVNPPAPPQTFVGLRGGLGLTGLIWTRTFLSHGLYADERGFYGDTLRVLSTLLLLPLALMNHAELCAELLWARPLRTGLTFRVGAGF
ncbi:MAG: hypothetical protein HYZ28_06785 [Myxococcales bacterium]|nr:hypothetical protein [Myxococcales bacterium]